LFKGKDILTAAQFSRAELDTVLNSAERMAERVEAGEVLEDLRGRVVASLFFEPSTRTRLSFEAAANRLGARVISVASAGTSSAAKGESLADTVRTVDGYVDTIVLRHPMKGSAELAARYARNPVINGGDGAGQHPTQALLDIYTIHKETGRLEDLTVTFVGDLKHGRTVHSLVYLAALYGNRMRFVSPRGLEMPPDITAELRSQGADIQERQDMREALAQSDVVYMTRIQKERFADPEEYEKTRGSYRLDRAALDEAKDGVVIMHPLPRVDEIAEEIDEYEGAAYFRQAHNGLYVRMALLRLTLLGD